MYKITIKNAVYSFGEIETLEEETREANPFDLKKRSKLFNFLKLSNRISSVLLFN